MMKKGAKVWSFIVILVIIGSAFVGVVSAEENIIDTEIGESGFMVYPQRSAEGWFYVHDHDTFHTRAYNGNFWYTLCGEESHEYPLYYGVWQVSLPQSGDYEVFVWIPDPDPFVEDWPPHRIYTPTQSAVYQIYHKDGRISKTVNQELRTGGFYSLGTFNFDTRASVILNDRTGESYLSTMIAFDAVKFVPVAAPNPPYTPSNPSPATHATGQSIHTDLSWTGGDPDAGDTVTYDVYFGTSTRPLKVSTAQSGTTYDPGTLNSNTKKYYWKIVATDNHGASTTGPLWDFTTGSAPNQPPNTPSMLFQRKSDGVTLIPVGSETTENSVTFKGVVSDPDGDQVKLQVELRRLDEYVGQFDETQGGFKESGFLESGSEAVAYANDLIDADYHWRARAVDEHGNESEWEDFGNNFDSEVDFRVSWGDIKKYAPILNWPLKGEIEDRQILLGFGDIWRWTYCGGLPKKHTGVDLKANVGEDVYAAYDGVVKKVYTLSSKHNWGKGVVIEHSGFTTTYMHVNPVVNVGAHVNKGQKIAIIGSIDGYEHLHFGVRNSAYSDVSKRGALPQKQGDSDYDKEGHFTGCKNDPLFPEKFIDPMKLKYGSLGEGLTDEDRIEKIFTGPSTLEFANLNPEGELSTSLYKVIKQILDVEQAKMELEGQQEDILFNHIDDLLKQLDPEQQDKDLIIKDIVKDNALSENEEIIVGFLGGLSGVGITLLYRVPAPFLGEGAKWLGLKWGEQKILKDLHSATVKKPEIGRMEIVYDETPKNKIWINIILTDREDTIFITIPVVSKPLRTSWGNYICSPMWCGLTCPPEAAERALCPTIEDVQVIGLYSPGELRVYDSHGRITGLVKRKINEEIPNSAYFNNTVIIFFSTDSYRYEVVGTDTGTYSLSMTSAEELNFIDFTATDIPTTVGAIHQYTIDWAALSQGEKGVTVKMDSDGDGVFEKIVIADNKLSQEELTPTLPVHNTNTGKSFSSIQAAVDAASAGDTISVRDGTYTENVDIDKSITLKSSSGNPEYTIVDAVDSYADVFSVTADHVNISGFTVTGAPDFYGIYLYNADYCDISDNICSHNAASGIYLSGSNSNSISDNTCFNNGMGGICLSSSTKNSIANNTCSSNGFAGIDLGCSNQNSISNNLCCNNKLGIFLDATNNNRIYLNNLNNDCNVQSSYDSCNIWNSKEKITYSYNGKSHTKYLGNYWSDYTGTDADKNGIGDSPYGIHDYGGDIDQDYYPLMTWSEHYTWGDFDESNKATCTNTIGMEFVLIPAGEFDMGSPSDEEGRYSKEGPVHHVTIENSFYMGKYEVTQNQWRAIMGDNPSYFTGDDNLPVESVSWVDVQEFIRKLNEKEGTDKYRLPSEAEWEYACRAGTTTRYSFGDDDTNLGDYVWTSDWKTHPVGKKKPNSWELYDMHGSVSEWVQDSWHSSYSGAPVDGSAWENGEGAYRVRRGCGWNRYPTKICRSAYRGCAVPGWRGSSIGFRLLKEQ